MRILALDTSTARGSVALLEDDRLIRETVLPERCGTAQALAPAMAELLQQFDWTPRSIELVALTSGPGSFTGLRIAVTTAKTYAYATGARLVTLNTLRVLVQQLPTDVARACAVMDAQRRQLFAAVFQRRPDKAWTTIHGCQIVDRQHLADLLSPSTLLTGPALTRLVPPLLARQPRSDPSCWLPRARTVGRLAWEAHLAGQYDDPLLVQPQYYRPSYAEERNVEPG